MTLDSKNSDRPSNFEFETGEGGFTFEDEIFDHSNTSIPKLSALNHQAEPYRLERLAIVWGSASATVNLMSEKYRCRWNGAIISLHDHKGMLRIDWRDAQSRIMFEGAIEGAWQRLGERWRSHGLSTNSSDRLR